MSTQYRLWQLTLLSICLLTSVPSSQARQYEREYRQQTPRSGESRARSQQYSAPRGKYQKYNGQQHRSANTPSKQYIKPAQPDNYRRHSSSASSQHRNTSRRGQAHEQQRSIQYRDSYKGTTKKRAPHNKYQKSEGHRYRSGNAPSKQYIKPAQPNSRPGRWSSSAQHGNTPGKSHSHQQQRDNHKYRQRYKGTPKTSAPAREYRRSDGRQQRSSTSSKRYIKPPHGNTSSKSHDHDRQRDNHKYRQRYKGTPKTSRPHDTHARSKHKYNYRQREYKIRHKHYARPTRSHERHYQRYWSQPRHRHHYYRHETYHYHTHYLAPLRRHYHAIGFHLHVLPHSYLSIYIGGTPYYYYDGVYYRHHVDGYVVVHAPPGARISVLPVGFISFYVDGFTYYYVNDTYYRWDEPRETYIVVRKPIGADEAIADATSGRLYVYPKRGQSEEQQAKDRYECHRWAVHQTGIDPTLTEKDDDISEHDKHEYTRALTACLEGRGYTVE